MLKFSLVSFSKVKKGLKDLGFFFYMAIHKLHRLDEYISPSLIGI